MNLGSGRETAIRELVETICKVMGYEGTIVSAPERPADVRRHCASVEKAEKLIGPIAQTSLATGLKATIDWYVTKFQGGRA
jgi:nucleoside-diphosphate-sugar epimerase